MHRRPMNTPPNPDNDKKRCYISLPYYGSLSYQLRKDLYKCLKPLYPNFEFQYIFSNKFTISSLFPFKDKAPKEMASLVTYLFTYPSCEARYIGKTSVNFITRVHQHLGYSVTTKKKSQNTHLPQVNIKGICPFLWKLEVFNELRTHLGK